METIQNFFADLDIWQISPAARCRSAAARPRQSATSGPTLAIGSQPTATNATTATAKIIERLAAIPATKTKALPAANAEGKGGFVMALIDIARVVLKQNNNRPMRSREIWDYIRSHNLWRPPKGGSTPADTLAERINSHIKRGKPLFVNRNGKFMLTAKGMSDAIRTTDGGKKGYVYVVSNKRSFFRQNWVKIGVSEADVGSRIYVLNTAVPYNFRVEVLMYTVGYEAIEKKLHKIFAEYCGDEDSEEYFTVSPEVVAKEMEKLSNQRTYRGAKLLVDSDDQQHKEILKILRKSKNDPTKRNPLTKIRKRSAAVGSKYNRLKGLLTLDDGELEKIIEMARRHSTVL